MRSLTPWRLPVGGGEHLSGNDLWPLPGQERSGIRERRFFTGKFRHDVVFGSTGYKFSTWQAENSLTAANHAIGAQVLCTTPGLPTALPATDCYANIDSPKIGVNPAINRTQVNSASTSLASFISRIQLWRYHHFQSALAGTSSRKPGLDLDQQLQGERDIS